MPFKSVKQASWMFANKPEIARRWVREYGGRFSEQGGAGERTKEAKAVRDSSLPKGRKGK